MPTAEDVYRKTIRPLPPNERLRLAALILDDLARPKGSATDESDTWSGRDEADVVAFSLSYAASLYPEDEDLV